MLPPLSLSLLHLAGTLCSEISHCVRVMEKDGVRGVRLSDEGECLGERCGAAGRDAPEVVRGGGGERMHEDRGGCPPPPIHVPINSLNPLLEAAGDCELQPPSLARYLFDTECNIKSGPHRHS